MDRYVAVDGRRLRCGVTTGSCASAAAAAAAELLLMGEAPDAVELSVPAGGRVRIPVVGRARSAGAASCAVRKDAGDDPDVTDGVEIWADVSLRRAPGIEIEGGEGVGRVTLPGLDQPVGSAAINSVPRQMIRSAVGAVCARAQSDAGLKVVIRIPAGAELAKRTFNPRMGIVGGLSVLGTSGIVEPMSERAMVDSIRLEARQRAALGRRTALLTPGNYGRDFLRDHWGISEEAAIRCSNFIGDLIDCCVELGFERILLAGHLGKLVKLAGNVFNTHSRYGDCRMDILTAHAAMCGATREQARQMMRCATVDAALDVLEGPRRAEPGCSPCGVADGEGVRGDEAAGGAEREGALRRSSGSPLARETVQSILMAVRANLQARAGRPVAVALFTNARGLLARSEDFEGALAQFREEEK